VGQAEAGGRCRERGVGEVGPLLCATPPKVPTNYPLVPYAKVAAAICKIGSGVRFTFWLEVLTKNLKATD